MLVLSAEHDLAVVSGTGSNSAKPDGVAEYEIVVDGGSGLNEDREGFKKILSVVLGTSANFLGTGAKL